jgi:hypothetical protein
VAVDRAHPGERVVCVATGAMVDITTLTRLCTGADAPRIR